MLLPVGSPGLADVVAQAARLVVLSRGLNYPTAHELALKLKELALLEAEALSGADFRHGPIALAGPRLPAIVVSPPGTATEADLAELAAELRRLAGWLGLDDVVVGARGGLSRDLAHALGAPLGR